MNLVPKSILTLLGFVFLGGCDSKKPPVNSTPSVSNTVRRGVPDFTPLPGTIPTVDDAEHVGPKFYIRITSDGQIYRNGQLTSKSELVDELLAIPNVGDFALIIEGNSDLRVSVVTELQSFLRESVPELETITYITVRNPIDG